MNETGLYIFRYPSFLKIIVIILEIDVEALKNGSQGYECLCLFFSYFQPIFIFENVKPPCVCVCFKESSMQYANKFSITSRLDCLLDLLKMYSIQSEYNHCIEHSNV